MLPIAQVPGFWLLSDPDEGNRSKTLDFALGDGLWNFAPAKPENEQ